MRDLFFLFILLSFFAINFRLPYFLALGYLWIDYVQPQRLSYWFVQIIPVSLIVGAGAFVSWLLFDSRKRFHITFPQILTLLIVAYATLSTFSWSPIGDTYKWDWASKSLLFGAFLPFVLTTRARIEAAAAVIILSISAIAISAAAKVVLGGGGYGVIKFLVRSNAGIYEGSTLAATTMALIPLIWWAHNHFRIVKRTRLSFLFALGITGAMTLVTVGAEARTGIVAGIVLLALWWIRTRRKLLLALAVAVLAIPTVVLLPDSFKQRAGTIQEYSADVSASTRLAVWKWTWDYVKQNPLGGGFSAYVLNSVDVTLVKTERDGNSTTVATQTIHDRARAFHSSYFEVLGELGFPGLALFLALLIAVYVWLVRIRRRSKQAAKEAADPPDSDAAWFAGFAPAAFMSLTTYLAGAAFVGIAYQPFLYDLIALVMSVGLLQKQQAASAALAVRRPPQTAGAASASLRPQFRGGV